MGLMVVTPPLTPPQQGRGICRAVFAAQPYIVLDTMLVFVGIGDR